MADYAGVNAKFARAIELLESFETELGTWVKSDPLAMIRKPNVSNPLSEELYLEIRYPIPTALNVLLGDAVHNFRSTLDHLAMALAIDNGTDSYDRSVSFPICNTFRSYHGYEQHETPIQNPPWSGVHKIRALRTPEKAFIEGLQPYLIPAHPFAWTLHELQELDNRDKHRTLIELNPEAIATFHEAPGTSVIYVDPLRLKDGARFATITFDADYAGAKVYPPVSVAIGVEHSNRIGWHTVPGFFRDSLVSMIQGIIDSAKRIAP